MERLRSNKWRSEQVASHKRKLRVEVEAQMDSGDPEKQCERFAQKLHKSRAKAESLEKKLFRRTRVAVPSGLFRTYDGVRQTRRRH